MAFRTFLAFMTALLLGTGVGEACTPVPSASFTFPVNSFVVPPDRVAALREIARPVKMYHPGCSTFEVRGYIEPTENGELVVGRIEAVKQVLVAEGAIEEQVSTKIEAMPAARSRSGNTYARTVTARWTWASGQWRCDPESKNPNYSSATCQKLYSRC